MLANKKLSWILAGLFLGILLIRWIGIQALRPSLGLDSVYLQTVDVFKTLKDPPMPKVTHPALAVRLSLEGWPDLEHDTPPLENYMELVEGTLVLGSLDHEILPRGDRNAVNPLSFHRSYHSRSNRSLGPLGYGWRTSWDIRLTLVGSLYVFQMPDGNLVVFHYLPKENQYRAIQGASLGHSMRLEGSLVILRSRHGQIFEFSQNDNHPTFQLSRIHHQNGVVYELSRESGSSHPVAVVETVSGRETRFGYDPRTGLIETVTFPSQYQLNLYYDTRQNLVQVKDSQGTYMRSYAYTSENHHHLLTGMGEDQIRRVFVYEHERLVSVNTAPFGDLRINRDPLLGMTRVTLPGGSTWDYLNLGDRTLQVTGPLQFKTRLEFNPSMLPVTLTDSRNQTRRFTWNQNARLIQKEQYQSLEIFDYDAQGNLTRRIDPLGNMVRYQYHGDLLTSVFFPDEENLQYRYQGRFLESIYDGAKNAVTRYHHDPSGNLLEVQLPGENTVSIRYNPDGFPIEKQQGAWVEYYQWLGGRLQSVAHNQIGGGKRTVIELGYNAAGQVVSRKDESRQETRFQYDPLGRVREMTLPDQTRHSFRWDLNGNMLSWQKPTGLEVVSEYDALGRPTLRNQGGQTPWHLDYDSEDEHGNATGVPVAPFHAKPSRVRYPDGQSLLLFYDRNGKMVKQQHSSGASVEWEYDEAGNPVTRSVDGTVKTHFAYDANQYLEAIFQPEIKRAVLLEHDRSGNLLTYVAPDGETWYWDYTPAGLPERLRSGFQKSLLQWTWNIDRTLSRIQARGGRIQDRFYNRFGHLASLQDNWIGGREWVLGNTGQWAQNFEYTGRGVEWTYYPNQMLNERRHGASGVQYGWTYDLEKRPKRVSGVAPYEFTWTAQDRITKLTYDRSTALLIQHDPSEQRVVKKTYPGLLVQLYHYNDQGQLTSVSENNLDVIQFQYDGRGKPIRIVYPNNTETRYEYDARNRVRALVTTKQDGTVLFRREYQYGARDQAVLIQTEREVKRRDFGPMNELLEESLDDRELTKRFLTWDGNGHVTSEKIQTSKTSMDRQWTYDQDKGRLVKITRQGAAPQGGGDVLSRMHFYGQADESPGFLEINQQVVQLTGNRFTLPNMPLKAGENPVRVHAIDAAGRESRSTYNVNFEPQADVAYLYDSSGRMIFKSQQGRNTAFTYDDEGRLESLLTTRGGSLTTTTYRYYANHLPAVREITVEGTPDSDEKSRYLFDEAMNIIGELPLEGTGYNHLYFFTPEGQILFRIDRGHKKYYYHWDKDGSIMGITDGTGEPVAAYSYDAFGRPAFVQEKITNPYRYLGHFFDTAADTYFHRGFIGNSESHAEAFGGLALNAPFGEPLPVRTRIAPDYPGPRISIPDPLPGIFGTPGILQTVRPPLRESLNALDFPARDGAALPAFKEGSEFAPAFAPQESSFGPLPGQPTGPRPWNRSY